MPLVFLSPIKKTYKSEVCSLSTLLALFLLLAAILIPLFAVYTTEDFWVRITEYTEQPLVDYYENYMIYFTELRNIPYQTYFDSSSNILNDNFPKICGSNGNNCQKIGNGFLTYTSTDIDGDGIKDKITIKYEFGEGINRLEQFDVKLIFFLKYGLTKKVKLIMTPMIYINIPIFINDQGHGKEIRLNGNLELIQKSPIISSTITSQVYNIKNPLQIKYNDSSPYDLLYYYNLYKSNNYTLKYNYEKLEKTTTENKKIQIIIDMYIPKLQKVLYVQSIYESIKYAWMQYFYIFLPIYIILYILFKFIIQNNIFYSQIKSDI